MNRVHITAPHRKNLRLGYRSTHSLDFALNVDKSTPEIYRPIGSVKLHAVSCHHLDTYVLPDAWVAAAIDRTIASTGDPRQGRVFVVRWIGPIIVSLPD
jgi:hypothetical protein